jgi:hypothetical protein
MPITAVLFWQLSTARHPITLFKPIFALHVLGYLAFAVTSYLYFVAGPVIVEVLIAISLGSAFLAMQLQRATSHP